MNLRELPEYQTRFLSANSLQGRTAQVTIEHVEIEEMYDKQKRAYKKQAVLYFVNSKSKKGLVVNKTRLEALEQLFGTDDHTAYPGKQVMLSPGKQAGKDTIVVSGVPAAADNAASQAAETGEG